MKTDIKKVEKSIKKEGIKVDQKKILIPALGAAIIIVVVVVLILIIVFSISPPPENNIENTNFSDCKILADSCLAEDCQYYFLCSQEAEISNCKVYDCDKDYGIIIEKQGKVLTSTQAKPDPEKVQKMVDDCQGEIEIIGKECKDDSLNINLKVKTAGDCKINAFLVDLGEKNYVQPSWEKKDDSFKLTAANSCSAVEVIAVGTGGVAIKKSIQ